MTQAKPTKQSDLGRVLRAILAVEVDARPPGRMLRVLVRDLRPRARARVRAGVTIRPAVAR